jgi:hypothetical protein
MSENPPTEAAYLLCVLIVGYVVLSFGPIPFSAAMIAIEMPVEMKPYSIVVASLLSRLNWRSFVIIGTVSTRPIKRPGPQGPGPSILRPCTRKCQNQSS